MEDWAGPSGGKEEAWAGGGSEGLEEEVSLQG